MSEAIRFPIRGMTCTSCVNRIIRALRRLDGVQQVSVDLRRETATVRRVPSLVSNADLGAAVAAAGFEADLGAAVSAPTIERRGLVERFLTRIRSSEEARRKGVA